MDTVIECWLGLSFVTLLSVPAAAALHPRAGAPHPHLPDCERVHHRGRGRGQSSNLPAAHRQGRIGTDSVS